MPARFTCTALLLLLLGGCGITPVPQPPSFDPSLLTTAEVASSGDQVRISGARGSANGTIYAINLDDEAAPAVTEASDDGTFSLTLVVRDGDVVRIQARNDLERSLPVDLAFVDGMIGVMTQNAGCVSVPLELELGAVPAGEVSQAVLPVQSSCREPVAVDEVRVRVGDVLAIEDPPTELTDGTTDIELTIGAPPSGTFEDVVFVITDDGRFAVSVFGVAE